MGLGCLGARASSTVIDILLERVVDDLGKFYVGLVQTMVVVWQIIASPYRASKAEKVTTHPRAQPEYYIS